MTTWHCVRVYQNWSFCPQNLNCAQSKTHTFVSHVRRVRWSRPSFAHASTRFRNTRFRSVRGNGEKSRGVGGVRTRPSRFHAVSASSFSRAFFDSLPEFKSPFSNKRQDGARRRARKHAELLLSDPCSRSTTFEATHDVFVVQKNKSPYRVQTVSGNVGRRENREKRR